jgi:radical SAM superfamily enzyme YgiQ (UPF0313 family)
MVPPFPLGLAYVAANVDARRHEVSVWDAMFHDDWEASLRLRLREFPPDAIGLSVRNVDDQDIRKPQWLLEEVKQVVVVCRGESAAPVVAGGVGFSMFAHEALAYLDADYGIVGEGEHALNRLLDALERGVSPADVPGLVRREGGEIRTSEPERIERLDELTHPDYVQLQVLRYHETQGDASIPNTATVQTKRGCAESCIYCTTPAIGSIPTAN